ncbi:MAG: hypothetical protein SGJ02_03000 [bacterium]|nr:hypothetical protein [bacterium]
MTERDTEGALRWVVGIFEELKIPYHITGGFAAKLYGAKRELNDLDFEIPDARLPEVFEKVKPFISDPLSSTTVRQSNSTWDLLNITVNFKGQDIDISGGSTAKIFNKNSKKWDPIVSDFENVRRMKIYGLEVPVQNKVDLITYKDKISYDEQKHQEDIVAIKKWKPVADFLKKMFA